MGTLKRFLSAIHTLVHVMEIVWYADQGVRDVEKRLIGDIFQRTETLGTNTELGRIVPEFDQPYLRELNQAPLRIIYRRDPGKVRIVHT